MMCDVSILMPVYNGMPYLRQAVQSLLDQTCREWRCVIVNDGSTDGTADFLNSLHDDRFVILEQENAGISAAVNHGLQYCDTRYTARMDADDVSLPTRLAEQVAFLDAHPEVGLVGVQMAMMGSEGVGASLRLPTEHDDIMHALMTGRHAMGHSCIMLRTDLLKQIGGYWSLPMGEEYDMMMRLGEIARLASIDHVLHHYRVHESSLTASRMRTNRQRIALACEQARRRRAGLSPITVELFERQYNARPLWRRAVASVGEYARCQYRVALAELHGGRRGRGLARMAWAAICAPKLAVERVVRMLPRSARSRSSSAAISANHEHDAANNFSEKATT